MDAFFTFALEKKIFEEYIYELDDNAFKVFLRLLWLSCKRDEINVRRKRTLRRLLCIDIHESKAVWDNLIDCNFVIKKELKNKTVYNLNYKKLKAECEFEHKLKVAIYEKNFIVERKEEIIIAEEEAIARLVKKTFVKSHKFLVSDVFRVLQNLRLYHIEKNKSFTKQDVARFLVIMLNYDDDVIAKFCLRYNSQKIAGQRGLSYSIKTLQKINEEKLQEPSNKIVETVSTTEVDKRKLEGELKFAIKLAIGDIESSLIYKRLLKTNDVEQLNKFWMIGVEELRKDCRQNEIKYSYDWLKLEDEMSIKNDHGE